MSKEDLKAVREEFRSVFEDLTVCETRQTKESFEALRIKFVNAWQFLNYVINTEKKNDERPD